MEVNSDKQATQAESRIPTSVRRRSFLPQRRSLTVTEPVPKEPQSDENVSSTSQVTQQKKPSGGPSPSRLRRGLKPPAVSVKQATTQLVNKAEVPKKSVSSETEIATDNVQQEKGSDVDQVSKATKKAKVDRRRSGIPSFTSAKTNPKLKSVEEKVVPSLIPSEESVPAQPKRNLKLGARVTIGGAKCGVLNYIGTVHFSQGEWCGIELDEPIGNHDGMVHNVRYFECREKHGIFAAASKVELDGACGETEPNVKPKVYGKPPKPPSKLALPKYGRSLKQPRQTIYATGAIATVFPTFQSSEVLNSADTSEAKDKTSRIGKGKTGLFHATRVSPIQERDVSPAWTNAQAEISKEEPELKGRLNTTITKDSTFTLDSDNPGCSTNKSKKTRNNSTEMAATQEIEMEASYIVDEADTEPSTAVTQEEPQVQTDAEVAEAETNVVDSDAMEIQLDTEERLHESLGSPEVEIATRPHQIDDDGEMIPDVFQEGIPDVFQEEPPVGVIDNNVQDVQHQDSNMELDRQDISVSGLTGEQQPSLDQPEIAVPADGTSSSTPESQDTKSVDSLETGQYTVEEQEGVTVVQTDTVKNEAGIIPNIEDITADELQTEQMLNQEGVPLPSSSHDGTFTKDSNKTYTADEDGPLQTLLPSGPSSEFGTSSSGQDNSPDSLEEQDQVCKNKDNVTFTLGTESMDVEEAPSDDKQSESAISVDGQPIGAAAFASPFPDVVPQVLPESADEMGPDIDKTFIKVEDNISCDPAHSILRLDELSMLPEVSTEDLLQEDVVMDVHHIATVEGEQNLQTAESNSNDTNMNAPLTQILRLTASETEETTEQSQHSEIEHSTIVVQATKPLESEDSPESSSDRAQVESLPESERESPTSNDLSSGNTISTDLDSGVGQGDKAPASSRESPTSDDASLQDDVDVNVTKTVEAAEEKDVTSEEAPQAEYNIAAPSTSFVEISTAEALEVNNVIDSMSPFVIVEKTAALAGEREVEPPMDLQQVEQDLKPFVEDNMPTEKNVVGSRCDVAVVTADAVGMQAAAVTDAAADEAAVGLEALDVELLPDGKVEDEDTVVAGHSAVSEEEPPHKVAKVTDKTFEVDDNAGTELPAHDSEHEDAKATFVTEGAVGGATIAEVGVVTLELEKLDQTFDTAALVTSTPFQHREFSFSKVDPESPSFGMEHGHLEEEESLIVEDIVKTLEPDIIEQAADNQHISGEKVAEVPDLDKKDEKKKEATRTRSSSDVKTTFSQGSQAKKARTTSVTSTKQKAPARASVAAVSKAADAKKTTAKASTQFVSKLAVPRTSIKNQANAVAQQSKGAPGSRFKSDSSTPSDKARPQPPANTFKTPMGPSSKVGLVRPTPRASPYPLDKKAPADKTKEQPSSSSSTSSPAQRRRVTSTVADKRDAASRTPRTPSTRSATTTTPQARRTSITKESSRSTSGTSSATSSPVVRKRLSSTSELHTRNGENSPSRASSRSSSVSGSPIPKRMSSRTHINGHATSATAVKDQSSPSQRASTTSTSTPRSDRSGTSTPTSTRSRSNSTSAVRSSSRPGSAASIGSVSSPRSQLKAVAARIDTGLKKRDSSTSLASTKSDGGKEEGSASAKEKSASQSESCSKKRVQLRIIPSRQILYGRLKLKKHSMRKNLLKLICGSRDRQFLKAYFLDKIVRKKSKTATLFTNELRIKTILTEAKKRYLKKHDKDEKSGTRTNKAETKTRPTSAPSSTSHTSSSQKRDPSSTQKKTLTTLSHHVEETDKPTNRKHTEILHSERNGHTKRRVSTSSTHSSTSDLSVTSNTSSRLSSSHDEARAQRAKADALSKPSSARSTKVPSVAVRHQGRYLPTPGSRPSPMPGTSGVKRGGDIKTSATVSPSPKRVLPVPPSPATRAHHDTKTNGMHLRLAAKGLLRKLHKQVTYETRGSRIKAPVSPPPTKASQPDLVASNSVTPSKSSKEIARLEALCEARTKELNFTKMQLKEGMTGFDAMAVLVKYLTEEMDAFSHPTLLTQIQRLQEELHHARSERDSQKLDLERLQNDIHNAIASHKDHINKLKDDHAAELKLQEDEFQIVRQAEVGKLTTQHRLEVEILADSHKNQLHEIREAHQAATRDLEQKQAEEIRNIESQHAQEIQELKRQHQEQVDSLTANFEKTRLSLEDQIETLHFQCQRQKDKAQMFEEALNKDTDMRVQAAITPYKHLPAEVDSLKAVLDIKSQEVHDLRKRNMELDKQVSEIPDLKDKIKMLERKTEDLEAMLSIKAEFQRQISTEHAQLRQQYEQQEYASKRLSMENEELQWKLRNSGSSSPIDAASPIIMGSPARVPRTAITPTLERRRSPTEKRKSLSRSQSTSSDTGIFYTISDDKPSS